MPVCQCTHSAVLRSMTKQSVACLLVRMDCQEAVLSLQGNSAALRPEIQMEDVACRIRPP